MIHIFIGSSRELAQLGLRNNLAGFPLMASCACLCLLACVPILAEEPVKIWDREILSQPFDHEPFRQVAIPDWVHDTLGCGYTLSVMNTRAREQAASHGVAISEMGFVDPFYA